MCPTWSSLRGSIANHDKFQDVTLCRPSREDPLFEERTTATIDKAQILVWRPSGSLCIAVTCCSTARQCQASCPSAQDPTPLAMLSIIVECLTERMHRCDKTAP